MKGWMAAHTADTCAYDASHAWAAGEQVFVVEGSGWRKVYCAACGRSRHGGAVVGAMVDQIREASLPAKPLAALAKAAGERFDVRAASARNDA